MSALLNGCEAKELPGANFVRSCRIVLQNLNETLAAYRLGLAQEWHQLFTDGTSRRQIKMQNLVIAVEKEDNAAKLDPVLVSSCALLADETAENQVKVVMDQVRSTVRHGELTMYSHAHLTPKPIFYQSLMRSRRCPNLNPDPIKGSSWGTVYSPVGSGLKTT